MKTLIVANNGISANATGSEINPYPTLEQAVQAATPGDTILLREGDYRQPTTVNVAGQPEAPITITRYPAEKPRLLDTPDLRSILRIEGASITVDGLTLVSERRSTEKFSWVEVVENARGTVLRNLSLFREGDISKLFSLGYRDFGIVVEAPDVTIDACRLVGMCKGIQVKGKAARRVTITHNHIGPTIQSNIVMATGYGVVRGVLIAHNVLEGSYREDGIQFMQDFDSPNPPVDVSNLGTIVYHNVIRDESENAIDLKGAGLVVIDGNLITRIMGSNDGLAFGGNRNSLGAVMRGARTTARQVIARNNVIYNASSGISLYEEFHVYHNVILWNRFDYTGPGSLFHNDNYPTFVGIRQGLGNIKRAAVKNNLIGLHEVDLALASVNNGLIETAGNYLVSERKMLATLLAGAEPLTDLHALEDFCTKAGAPLCGAGVPLTYTVGSGTGSLVPVKDAGYFTDWFGRKELPAEVVYLDSKPYTVVGVDLEASRLRLDQPAEWRDQMPVYWLRSQADIGLHWRPPAGEPLPPEPPQPEPTTETVRLVLEFTASSQQVELLRQLLQSVRTVVQ